MQPKMQTANKRYTFEIGLDEMEEGTPDSVFLRATSRSPDGRQEKTQIITADALAQALEGFGFLP